MNNTNNTNNANLTNDEQASIKRWNQLRETNMSKVFAENYNVLGVDEDEKQTRALTRQEQHDALLDADEKDQRDKSWNAIKEQYRDRMKEYIRKKQAKTLNDVLGYAKTNSDVLESIKRITKSNRGGKSRVFRKKVSRRNRNSRIRRRRSRTYKHK